MQLLMQGIRSIIPLALQYVLNCGAIYIPRNFSSPHNKGLKKKNAPYLNSFLVYIYICFSLFRNIWDIYLFKCIDLKIEFIKDIVLIYQNQNILLVTHQLIFIHQGQQLQRLVFISQVM